jgi:hypothetical protein
MTESAPITIDELLSKHTKNLKPGESISIPLYKSRGTISTIDPIQASRAQKAAASVGAKTLTRSFLEKNEMKFPRLMKFNCPVVTKPDWDHNLKDGRLYIEDIPKAKVCCKYFLNASFLIILRFLYLYTHYRIG